MEVNAMNINARRVLRRDSGAGAVHQYQVDRVVSGIFEGATVTPRCAYLFAMHTTRLSFFQWTGASAPAA
jgi:hypothetical protein